MHASSLPNRESTLLVLAADYDRSADPRLLAHARRYDRTLVVAPTTPPPDGGWIVDDDAAARHAHDRADTIAAYLRSHGDPAQAEVGDPDPLLAAVDAIALHQVDGVLILASDDRSGRRLAHRSARLARPADVVTLRRTAAARVPPNVAAAH
jgi:hypothetical protein